MKTLIFNATDTLFFRESRPFEGSAELQSVFPPSMQTVAGAVRTFIGNEQGVQWHDFKPGHELTKIIGYGDDLGSLSFKGVWLSLNNERLYPAPVLLMRRLVDNQAKLSRLRLSEETLWCDLGKQVRFGKLEKDEQGSKPLENTWLTAAGLSEVLQGNCPEVNQIFSEDELYEKESRLGIARDNVARVTKQGMLYQTQHIRPKDNLSIEVDVSGLPDSLPDNTILRLGGEGRSASLNIRQQNNKLSDSPKANKHTKGLILYLLTPLKHQQDTKQWQPLPGFIKEEQAEQTIWIGVINGIALELHSAVTGKSTRNGGWDLANRKPRTANSLIPAGSAFFCKVKSGDINAALKKLHNSQLGEQTEYGLGHIVAGLWLKK